MRPKSTNPEMIPFKCDPDDLLSTKSVAKIIGTTPRYVRAEIQRGALAATYIGSDWIVTRKALNYWLNMRIKRNERIKRNKEIAAEKKLRGPGRPRKQEPENQ